MNTGSVNPIKGLDVVSGVRPTRTEMVEKSPVFDPNLQEQLIPDYDQKLKLKLLECATLIAGKKSLMTIIFRQWDDVTKTESALGASYKANRAA